MAGRALDARMFEVRVVVACVVACGCGDNAGLSSRGDASPGAPDATAPDAGGPPVTLTIVVYEPPTFVLVKDGEREWTAVPAVTGVHEVDIHSDSYMLARACSDVDDARVSVDRALMSEMPTLSVGCAGPGIERDATVTGTVAGIVEGDGVYVQFPTDTAYATFSDPEYEATIAGGTVDVLLRRTSDEDDAYTILRDATVDDGDTLDLDISGAIPVETHALEISGLLEDEEVDVLTHFVTAGGADAFLFGTPTAWKDMPASLRASTDRSQFRISPYSPGAGTSREAGLVVDDETSLAIELPSPMPAPSLTVTDTLHGLILTVDLERPERFVRRHLAYSYRSADDVEVDCRDTVTSGWLAANGGEHVTLDLATLDGWDAAWDYPSGDPLDWFIRQYTSDSPVDDVLHASSGWSRASMAFVPGVRWEMTERSGIIDP